MYVGTPSTAKKPNSSRSKGTESITDRNKKTNHHSQGSRNISKHDLDLNSNTVFVKPEYNNHRNL